MGGFSSKTDKNVWELPKKLARPRFGVKYYKKNVILPTAVTNAPSLETIFFACAKQFSPPETRSNKHDDSCLKHDPLD